LYRVRGSWEKKGKKKNLKRYKSDPFGTKRTKSLIKLELTGNGEGGWGGREKYIGQRENVNGKRTDQKSAKKSGERD